MRGYGVNVEGPSYCYMGEISEKSKQYLPRKFDNMLRKFHFGPKFIKKPELLNNTVYTSPCNGRDVYEQHSTSQTSKLWMGQKYTGHMLSKNCKLLYLVKLMFDLPQWDLKAN